MSLNIKVYNMSATTTDEFRKKASKWCQKMLESGLISQDDYNNCYNDVFTDTADVYTSIPPQRGDGKLISRKNLEYNYGIYTAKKPVLTPSSTQDTLRLVLLSTENGEYLTANVDNKLSSVQNIDTDTSINQTELQFKLVKSGEAIAIQTNYDYYISVQGKKTISTSNKLSEYTNWNLKNIDEYVYIEPNLLPNMYLGIINNVVVLTDRTDSVAKWLITDLSQDTNNLELYYKPVELQTKRDTLIRRITNARLSRLMNQMIVNIVDALILEVDKRYNDAYEMVIRRLDVGKSRVLKAREEKDKELLLVSKTASVGRIDIEKSLNLSDAIKIRVRNAIMVEKNETLKKLEEIKTVYSVSTSGDVQASTNAESDLNKFIGEIEKKLRDLKASTNNNSQILLRVLNTIDLTDKDLYAVNAMLMKTNNSLEITEKNKEVIGDIYKKQSRKIWIYRGVIVLLVLLILYFIYRAFVNYYLNVAVV